MKSLKKTLKKILFFIPDDLLGAVVFETRSFFLDNISKPLLINADGRSYINLGSGPEIVKGFINIDFFGTPCIDYAADLRKKLKISNNSVDGIFCEHTLEHLTYSTVDRLLGECYRILKTDGMIRIILPDISLFARNYAVNNQGWFRQWESLMFTNSSDSARKLRKLNTPMEAISFVTQEYGHVSAWDFETLSFYLNKNGFKMINKSSYMQGEDEVLLIDHDGEDRKFVSLYLEARK
jgi:predicted SAM-dependent methyltransferase